MHEGREGGRHVAPLLPPRSHPRPPATLRRLCSGLLGVSILIASGDSGVYNRMAWSGLPFFGEFHPSFPACLPAVTAVGATKLEADGSEDSGVSFSGGGFSPSKYFTRANATWQDAAVEAYLSSGVKLPAQRKWDRNGRGIPDVSAVGVNFQVVTDGVVHGASGTSASTPSVAGIFSLLNDARMSAGKRPLGFLNPFIYKARTRGTHARQEGMRPHSRVPP